MPSLHAQMVPLSGTSRGDGKFVVIVNGFNPLGYKTGMTEDGTPNTLARGRRYLGGGDLWGSEVGATA